MWRYKSRCSEDMSHLITYSTCTIITIKNYIHSNVSVLKNIYTYSCILPSILSNKQKPHCYTNKKMETERVQQRTKFKVHTFKKWCIQSTVYKVSTDMNAKTRDRRILTKGYIVAKRNFLLKSRLEPESLDFVVGDTDHCTTVTQSLH